ncbi:hypothetical protein ACFWBH_35875 [Streptomyces sp. NPDC059999]|uniref:ATP-dependent DNA ligase n=1 Tax=Streptomyces sp. NPDC059999 TaxID=3347030 RepID=UPI00367C3B85
MRALSPPPAYFVAFDILQADDGTELLVLAYRERRRRLEVLFAARGLTAPWTLCPMTPDPAKAREWLEDWTDVSGVEGLVVKGMNRRYRPGARPWTKIRRRGTTEVIIGAITGTLARPQLLILGRHDQADRFHSIGRTVPPAPGRGPPGRRAPDCGRAGASVDGGAVRLGLGLTRHPGHDPGPPGAGRGDQRRHASTPTASTATRCAWTSRRSTSPRFGEGRSAAG